MFIWWLFTNYASQIAYVLGGLFVVNGLRKAMLRPRLQYVSRSSAGRHGVLLTVLRQELLPPWRTLNETWLIPSLSGIPVRVSDGLIGGNPNYSSVEYSHSRLSKRLRALLQVLDAKEAAEKEAVAELDRQIAEEAKLDATIKAAQRRAS